MKHLLISCLVLFLLFTGCTAVQNTIYLQDLEVTSPVSVPPLLLTTAVGKKKATFSPKFYLNNARIVEGSTQFPVNGAGFYQVDTVNGELLKSNSNIYRYDKKNLKWNIPDVMAGIDMDFPLGTIVSFNAGLNLSSASSVTLMGGTFGISLSTAADNIGLRLNTGINIQQFSYKALTIVESTYDPFIGETKTKVYFFDDHGKGTTTNFYISLTGNSDIPDFPINIYAGISFFQQDIVDFELESPDLKYHPFFFTNTIDARGEYASTFFGINPGIYKNLGDQARIIGGINMIFGLKELRNATRTSFILPFVKLELFL
jgi:hypothetical protein